MMHEMQEIKQVAEEMMQKMQKAIEDKSQKEAELKESKDRARRMKEMLAKALPQLKEGKILEQIFQVLKIFEKISSTSNKMIFDKLLIRKAIFRL